MWINSCAIPTSEDSAKKLILGIRGASHSPTLTRTYEHGQNAIDTILFSIGLEILNSEYSEFGMGTEWFEWYDHRMFWFDITEKAMFGDTLQHFKCFKSRRLKYVSPLIRNWFKKELQDYLEQFDALERAKTFEITCQHVKWDCLSKVTLEGITKV